MKGLVVAPSAGERSLAVLMLIFGTRPLICVEGLAWGKPIDQVQPTWGKANP